MLLLIAGRGVFWPFIPRHDPAVEHATVVLEKPLWVHLGRFLTRRARPVWIVSALLLVVMAGGLLHLDTNLTNAEGFTTQVGSWPARS